MTDRIRLAPWQFGALNSPYDHTAMLAGVATGKTFTGSHFAIKMMTSHPELTGLVGANTYDQLSQATLRELFYWLEYYAIPYVIDKQPPHDWGQAKRQFKSYHNILSALIRDQYGRKHVVTVFTRVMSQANPLRGVEISWYWIDETRDTPRDTHDVILSRMRESEITKGLVTSTTAGEDWAYQRFVRGNTGGSLYGSMHIPTRKSVEYGIITQKYYDSMRQSYSPLMAMQELDALHVNTRGGRAYYTFSDLNKLFRAPWGDLNPSRERALIVGCDFNYQPAPCVWMVGQVGPPISGPNGEWWPDHIHWFGEVTFVEAGTAFMTEQLLNQYPDFFYEIYGDASGNRGTTSNAGEHDYNQMAEVLSDAGAVFTIDVDQANPMVRNRVENMCRLGRNALGEVRMSYNPQRCPMFDADVRIVGWDEKARGSTGKLSNGGDIQRTHASDGAGYAVWKKFPPGRRAFMQKSMPSGVRQSINDVLHGR